MRARALALGAMLLCLGVLAAGTPVVAAPGAPPAGPAAPVRATLPGSIRPLMVVLDTSGSMAEEDVNGTVKLAGARTALTSLVRDQRPGATVGLWSYPDDADCGPGRAAFPVQPVAQTEMINQVSSLEADGNTPTGPALLAAVEHVKAAGFTGATVLLISDGMSNCGEPPCDVARSLVQQGFDITVQAMGFTIDDEGMDELRCIADATGGGVWRAEDVEELRKLTKELTTAELDVEVEGMPPLVPSGSARTVTVRVTNPTAHDVALARVGLDFAGDGIDGRPVVAPVLPPQFSLGSIGPGRTVERQWLVRFGTAGQSGWARYRVTAWAANVAPTRTEGRVEVSDKRLTLAEAGPLLAGLADRPIAIVGDSYSSGEGAGDYLPGTDGPGNYCHRSELTYLHPLFDDVELLACSGSTTHRLDDDHEGVREDQVWDLGTSSVDAAFMTIGGNDVGFGPLIEECVKGEIKTVRLGLETVTYWDTRCADDLELRDKLARDLQGLQAQLEETYEAVSEGLNPPSEVERRGEVAPLFVLGYPQVFPDAQWASWCAGFDVEEVRFANDIVVELNLTVARAVAAVRKKGYRVQFVDDAQEAFLPDNTACPRGDADPFVNAASLARGAGAGIRDFAVPDDRRTVQELLHPNKQGYAATTDAVLTWSQAAEDRMPAGVKEWRQGEEQWRLTVRNWLQTPVDPLLYPVFPVAETIELQPAADPGLQGDLRAGQRGRVRVSGGAPGTPVRLTVESLPRTLALGTLGEDGTAELGFSVPRDLPPGGHHLSVVMFDEEGQPEVVERAVRVAPAVPPWFLPLLLAVAVAAAGLLVAGYRARRRTRAREAVPSGT